MNCMKEIAELLGVRMDKCFNIDDDNNFYYGIDFKLTEDGLMEWSYNRWSVNTNVLWKLLTNRVWVKKPLLTTEEYKYLKDIIKPFEDQVVAIVKVQDNNGECIKIRVKDNLYPSVILPYFKRGTRFVKMKPNYEYLIENIDL